MTMDKNRLLLEIDKKICEVNEAVINPLIPELKLDDITPVMRLVARARAAYLKETFDVTAAAGEHIPTPGQIKRLRLLRVTFDELVHASQALETAIKRGYLDLE